VHLYLAVFAVCNWSLVLCEVALRPKKHLTIWTWRLCLLISLLLAYVGIW